MKPDTILKLGDFEFSRFEVPEEIPFGGEQKLIVHQLVGGVRVVDSMGHTPKPIDWSGNFTGSSALERARYIDEIRRSGRAIELSWSKFRFLVVIRQFDCAFRRFYRIPYRLSCEVIEDLTSPTTRIASNSIDDQIAQDMQTANGLASAIGNSGLTGAMSGLNSAIASVSNFASATQSTLNSVLLPIATVRSQVGILLQSASNTLQAVSTVGGILPNNPVASQVNRFFGQVAAATQSPNLVNLDRVLGRIQTNIGTINSGTQKVTVAGGNMFDIASKQYGNAMGWTAIADGNNTSDPKISGLTTLTIPPFNNDTDGILNA